MKIEKALLKGYKLCIKSKGQLSSYLAMNFLFNFKFNYFISHF